MADKINEMTAVSLGKEIAAGRVSVKEALDSCFEMIEKREDEINAYITLDKDNAYKS